MSTDRLQADRGFVNQRNMEKGPNGRNLCRRCRTEVPKGRQTFCSDGCVHEHKLRTMPSYVRQVTFERDKGVCAICGIDTNAIMKNTQRYFEYKEQNRIWGRSTLWDADHIVPVVEGGGACGIDNIRTLCIPCHRNVTADLRKRLSKKSSQP